MPRLKRSLFLNSILLITVFACQQEESPKPEEQVLAFGEVYTCDEPLLLKWLEELNVSKTNGRQVDVLDNINLEKASKMLRDNGLPVYSLTMPESDPRILTNLWIYITADGQLRGRILRYKMEMSWYQSFAIFPGWEKFNGTLSVYDMDENLLYETQMSDGVSIEDEASGNGRLSNSAACGDASRVNNYQVCTVTTWLICTEYDGNKSCHYDTTVDDCYWFEECGLAGGGGAGGTYDPYYSGGPSGGGASTGTGSDNGCGPGMEMIKGRCVLKCVRDEEGICVEEWEQTFGKLCDNITFLYSANSFKAEISGLGGTYFNRSLNKAINVELGTNCIDMPDYHLSTSHEAAYGFAKIFNSSRTQIEIELENNTLLPQASAIRTRLISIITDKLKSEYTGASFGLTFCQGEIPRTIADYDC